MDAPTTMSPSVFAAVLAAAALHAGWNAFLKVKLEPFLAMTLITGAGGLSLTGEITDYGRAAAEQRSRMLAVAGRAYILVDQTKFGRLTPIRIVEAERAAALILDREPPKTIAEALARRGLQTIIAA